MDFKEQFNIVIDENCTAGFATTVQYTRFFDMQNYESIDFLVSQRVQLAATGAEGATSKQQLTLAAYQATSATGGGASAISSATAVIGKDATAGFTTAAKCRYGLIHFSTLGLKANNQITIGTAVYTGSSAATTANLFEHAGATAAATQAVAGFLAMFNNATNNTSTAITQNWHATAIAGQVWVRILPKDPDGTHLLSMSNTAGSTFIGCGGVFNGHVSVNRQFLKKRYVALGVTATADETPYTVTVIRKALYPPTTSVAITQKSMNQSTSK
jgi:hypothetical protein